MSKFGMKVPTFDATRYQFHGQKVKVARSRDQSEPSWPNAVRVSLEGGGGIPCRPNPAATLLVIAVLRENGHSYSHEAFSVDLQLTLIAFPLIFGTNRCKIHIAGRDLL